jgi:hypothetical protein
LHVVGVDGGEGRLLLRGRRREMKGEEVGLFTVKCSCCCYGRYVLWFYSESGFLKFQEGMFLVELAGHSGSVPEVTS